MKRVYAPILAALGAIAVLSSSATAEDIDLFVQPASEVEGLPNVLILLDNTANWNTPFTNEKAALAATVNGLGFNTDGSPKFRLGLMLFTETGSGDISGSQRDYYAMNSKIEADIGNSNNTIWTGFLGWSGAPPHGFYALWQYAKAMNYTQTQAANLISTYGSKLKTTVNSTEISSYKNYFVQNSVIAGLVGYTELKKMANQLDSDYDSKKISLDSLLSTRATSFTKDVAWGGISGGGYCYSYTPSKNFIYLTPELGQYLHDNALSKVQTALNEYYHNTPYWFQEGFEDSVGEWIFTPFFDTNIFLAKAYILKENREDLVKYLDTPMFKAGDLFYIQNLIAAIEAPSSATCGPKGDIDCSGHVNATDLSILITDFGGTNSRSDLDSSGKVNVLDLAMLLSNFGQ